MTVYLDDGDVTLYLGDALETVRAMSDESVDCVVTSPPYWGLRDYGTGEWDGGDPDCDHRVREDARVESSTLGGGKGTTGHQREGFKDECPRCGARRVDQQMGLEPTPDLFVQGMVELFREIRRVLAPHGTCWVNLGDSYASSGDAVSRFGLGGGEKTIKRPGYDKQNQSGSVPRQLPPGLKPKDLVGAPWRVAFALQADGWWLRSDIIWAKPNPMPESVTDRPTKAHEYVFLLTKQPRYWFDAEAVREQFEARPQQRLTDVRDQPLAAARRAAGVQQGNPQGGTHINRFNVQEETLTWECQRCGVVQGGIVGGCRSCGAEDEYLAPLDDGGDALDKWAADDLTKPHWTPGALDQTNPAGRNVRSVWTIATQPYPEAHFATFPEELARRCILAGCPVRVCRVCGKPSERIVERKPMSEVCVLSDGEKRRGRHDQGLQSDKSGLSPSRVSGMPVGPEVETVGWTDCGCNDFEVPTTYDTREGGWRTGVVLDPFIGSGTTAKVARDHQRHAIGIDLNREYLELAARRLQQLSLLT